MLKDGGEVTAQLYANEIKIKTHDSVIDDMKWADEVKRVDHEHTYKGSTIFS